MTETREFCEEENENMSNQTEIRLMLEELVRVDEWAFQCWELGKKQETKLFKELQNRENIIKAFLQSFGVNITNLNLNF